MERSVAIKKLGKLLGHRLGYRVDPKAPSREEREAAMAELKSATEDRNRIREQLEARRKAILDGDAEYQRLSAENKAERDRRDNLWGISQHYKITVGTSSGMFFHVRAQGDSWEDVIDKIAGEKKVA